MSGRPPLLAAVAFTLVACGPSEVEVQEASDPRGPAPANWAEDTPGVQERRELAGGLVLEIRDPGAGRTARIGDLVTLHYRAHVVPAPAEAPASEEAAAPEEAEVETEAAAPEPTDDAASSEESAPETTESVETEPVETEAAEDPSSETSSEAQPEPTGPILLRSTYATGMPDRVRLGTDPLIPGLRRAIVGLAQGARVDVHVPATLAYGDSGLAPLVPPGADLMFELELVGVQR